MRDSALAMIGSMLPSSPCDRRQRHCVLHKRLQLTTVTQQISAVMHVTLYVKGNATDCSMSDMVAHKPSGRLN